MLIEFLSFTTSRHLFMRAPSSKVVIVGESAAGKTSIAIRQCQNTFSERGTSTVGLSNFLTNVVVKGQNVELKIWDTAGQERYATLLPTFVRNSMACLVVCDATRPETVESLGSWINIVKDASDGVSFVIGVNKCDLCEPQDVCDLVGRLSQTYTHVFSVSAKTGDGVDKLFEQLGATVLEMGQLKALEPHEDDDAPKDEQEEAVPPRRWRC